MNEVLSSRALSKDLSNLTLSLYLYVISFQVYFAFYCNIISLSLFFMFFSCDLREISAVSRVLQPEYNFDIPLYYVISLHKHNIKTGVGFPCQSKRYKLKNQETDKKQSHCRQDKSCAKSTVCINKISG